MFEIHDLWLFVLSGLLLNVTPGPDTAYIIGRSIQFGWRGGDGGRDRPLPRLPAPRVRGGDRALGAADGVVCGICAVKWAGAAYLLFTGIQMLRSRAAPIADVALLGDAVPLRRVFWLGVLTNALNPKGRCSSSPSCRNSSPRIPHKTLAFLLLGGIFIFSGTLWCLGIAAFAARAAGRIRRSRGVLAWINCALGGLFIYLGFRVAMLEAR